jgi:hypothetical protein
VVAVVVKSSSVSSRAATKSNDDDGCLDAFSAAKKLEFLSRAIPHLAVEDDDDDDDDEDAAVAPLFCRPHFVDDFA